MIGPLKKYRIQLIFLLAGAFGGLIYWKLIGCTSGSCPIKSVWYYSTLWGAVAGYLVGDLAYMIITQMKKKKNE
ncbi:DUF6132 family protein [Sunxiuqinia rutila]|uniref:DUF6132 family protein n=1 Tax=Sunxiuqinia rutila TaxID=1397841 RepID=UPI003D36A2D6